MALCNTMLTAVGLLPKMVCHRTVRPLSGKPTGNSTANCEPAVALPGNVSLLKLKPTSPGESAIGGTTFLYVGILAPFRDGGLRSVVFFSFAKRKGPKMKKPRMIGAHLSTEAIIAD